MKYRRVLIAIYMVSGLALWTKAQTPLITVRLANPQNDCVTSEYCLDVEFTTDLPDQEVFGMNIRFFYDDDVLELVDFRDFQGGYGPIAPNPPIITTSTPAGPALFNFSGPAEFVNGAMQLVNSGAPPIVLEPGTWTKLFQICYVVDDPNANLDTFCPSVVWDLEQDPANGGFLSGDDGVVVTIVDPDPNNESLPANEAVEQFNWQYTGSGTPPYGQPVELICNNINCALPIRLLSFTGRPNGNSNLLEWKVEDGMNFRHFEVQHSSDLMAWEDLGLIAFEPNNMNYYFTDFRPVFGYNYYRLALLDEDGRSSNSEVIAIVNGDIEPGMGVHLFPNPIHDGLLRVQLQTLPMKPMAYMLTDATGTLILDGQISDSGIQLDVKSLSKGVYFFTIESSGGVFTTRLILQ